MEIQIVPAPPEARKTPPDNVLDLEFGSTFTNHMFLMEWEQGVGWHKARIEKYQPLCLDPAAIIFHYGHEAFEGLKAYQASHGRSVMFRPQQNFKRLNRTTQRLGLPEIDEEFALDALKQLIRQDIAWIPKEEGASLYIRPTLIATEATLSLRQSHRYLFYIILSPVGPFYARNAGPVRILVSEDYVRATPGGVGDVKTAGNYAASNLAQIEAKAKGFSQVLWLDALERLYVEEVGSMNIFFVIENEVITPQLSGTILPGITRDSVLQLSRSWGLKTVERKLSIEEVVASIENGKLTEIFGTGTAAVITPVSFLSYRDQEYAIQNGGIGPIAQRFLETLSGIQSGKIDDPFQWLEAID